MVNTFVIDSDHENTAKILDYRRLGKQRVEARQMITAIEEFEKNGVKSKGWFNHPGTQMWIGYVENLKLYFNVMCKEWVNRGYKQNMDFYELDPIKSQIKPYWVEWKPLHYSHMASLLRKDTKYYYTKLTYPYLYNIFGYIWPTHLKQDQIEKLNYKVNINLNEICDNISNNKTPSEMKRFAENSQLYNQVCLKQFFRDYPNGEGNPFDKLRHPDFEKSQ